MTTLMVHLELGHANTRLLEAAADLAGRLGASVMGIAACQPIRIVYGDDFVSGDFIEQDRKELEKEIKEAEAEFRAALCTRVENLEWRSMITYAPLADYLAYQARCADLIVTGVERDRSVFDSSRGADIGDLVMRAGRPVLIVPAVAEKAAFERVLIGWKDTRESRRALFDALPLLRKASHVAICRIVPEEEFADARADLEDVIDWLKRHGIVAEPIVSISSGDDAIRLDNIASDQAADVIVAGAYGHSRLREWALGGVTKDLLLRAYRCSFVSR